ncbi:MAG TPA: PhnD/SsuA/transferrin family substrate-binding protein [Dissulfurispiraceae bacterium]|nr:PhnD/SsuA/transferrin family substrate-binding protein [Dissulfurispiraceae bacterium]
MANVLWYEVVRCHLQTLIRAFTASTTKWSRYVPTWANVLVFTCLFLVLIISTACCDTIKIGVLANRGDEKCLQMWGPTAEYLSNRLPGHKFEIVPLSFDKISAAVRNEEVDFLLANPSIYVDMETEYAISGIATLRSKYSNVYPLFGGVIFTRADNPGIFKLRDLTGRTFMAVHETSLGGWEVALREFKKSGIDPRKDFASLLFSDNHETVIHAVLDGKVDAGTANTDVFGSLMQNGTVHPGDFRILAPEGLNINRDDFPYPVSTRLYPNWPFSKLRKTPEDLAVQVAISLLAMTGDTEAAKAGDYKGWSYPLNYKDIRDLKKELGLGIYKDFEKASVAIFLQKNRGEVILVLVIMLISLSASIVLTYLYRRSKRGESVLRETQEALRQSEVWYRSVIDYTYNWEYWMDEDGNFLYVSPSCRRITGYGPKDFINDKELLYKIIHPDDLKLFRDHLHTITEGGEVIPIEFRIITAEGVEKWIGHVCQSVSSGDGKIRGRRVSNRDITDRKRIEKEREHLGMQLLQAQKMEAVGQLASGIAHDFNNVINAITGYSHLLADSLSRDHPVRSYVVEIIEATERAAEVTGSLLAFGRKQAMNVKPLDMNEVLRKFNKLIPRIIGDDIEVSIFSKDKEVLCMADAGRIDQVLLNLVNNARDAMPKGGHLTLGAEIAEMDESFIKVHGYGLPGAYALVTLSDTGIGMNKDVMEKIFEPFFTTKEAGKGTGLGLAMVYGIIKQHGGFINVYSEPGEGTTFRIYLPSVQSNIEILSREIEQNPRPGTEAILVAEDDNALRKLTDIVLTQHGYQVVLTCNGQEAIDKFIENKDALRLVVLDMIMPQKSGKEAFDEMRNVKPDIKCIFLSGHTADRIDKQSLEDKNIKLLLKPVSPKELLKQVRDLLDKENRGPQESPSCAP